MLAINTDIPARELRRLAKSEDDARAGRRMLAIANALSGMSRDAAATAAGMTRQTLRDWVIRYNEFGIEGLIPSSGTNDSYRLIRSTSGEEPPARAPDAKGLTSCRSNLLQARMSPYFPQSPSGRNVNSVSSPFSEKSP